MKPLRFSKVWIAFNPHRFEDGDGRPGKIVVDLMLHGPGFAMSPAGSCETR